MLRPDSSQASSKLTLASIDLSLNGMSTVTVSSKYQIVIPQEVREAVGLRAGQKVQVLPYKGNLLLLPVQDIKSYRGFARGIDTKLKKD